MDHAESVAKHLVEKLIPGSKMHFQADQSHSVPDFDLHLPDGSVEALEVTASVDCEAEETNAAIVDPKKGGFWIPTKLCKSDWHIHPARNARIGRIRKEADECLAQLEANGFDSFFGPGDWSKHEAVQRAYGDLRIFSGNVISGRTLGRISMAPPGGGGAVGALLAHEAAQDEAIKDDNRKKLAASGSSRRHLAVYVHARNYLPWVGLIDFEPPSLIVDLPVEITDLWVFSENRGPSGFSVWRARAGHEWQNVGPLTLETPIASS